MMVEKKIEKRRSEITRRRRFISTLNGFDLAGSTLVPLSLLGGIITYNSETNRGVLYSPVETIIGLIAGIILFSVCGYGKLYHQSRLKKLEEADRLNTELNEEKP